MQHLFIHRVTKQTIHYSFVIMLGIIDGIHILSIIKAFILADSLKQNEKVR